MQQQVRVQQRARAGRFTVAVTAAVLLAGCGSGSSGAAGAGTTSAAPVTTTSAAVTTTEPATSSAPATTTPAVTPTTKPATKPVVTRTTPAAGPVLVLESDGLGYVAGAASIKHLPFGTDAATVRTVVAKALGPLASNDLPDCGQGARKSSGRAGFSILVDGTKFVGWTDQGAKGRHLTTADGLGVGSTIAQVKAALPGVTVSDGSLGAEFTDDSGFGGIAAGMAATSKVTTVYAGETCFFR